VGSAVEGQHHRITICNTASDVPLEVPWEVPWKVRKGGNGISCYK
jgi:hypothetical protein